jgi:hypothetical protein
MVYYPLNANSIKRLVMTVDLMDYIVTCTPRTFLQLAVEGLEAAYSHAHREASTYEHPEHRRVQGQIRHYRQNAALRTAASQAGLIGLAAQTDPKGEFYTLVSTPGVVYGRISVNFSNRIPRAAKHRRAIAALNSHLEPINLDLFNPTMDRRNDELGVFLVTVNPDRRSPQDMPAGVRIGVPYSNFKGWHMFERIESVMAAYSSVSEIVVPDRALVTLKKRLKGAEAG